MIIEFLKKQKNIFPVLLGFALVIVVLTGLLRVSPEAASSLSHEIQSAEELESIIKNGSDKAFIFDLYADWCMPCRILSPTLEEIAVEKASKVILYKIDVDKHPGIANAFGAAGIPYVVIFHKGSVVASFSGAQPKENYLRAINSIKDSEKPSPIDKKAKASINTISADEAMELITSSNPVILDVRTPGEFSREHIPGAILIPVQDLSRLGPEKLKGFESKDILVYCRSGNRSIPASKILLGNGFLKIYNLKSGLIEWKRNKYPLES